MTVQLVSRAVSVIALLLLTASNWPREAHAQGADELASLGAQVSRLYSQGKYAEAAPIAERYVALTRRKHGDNNILNTAAISWLTSIYQAQGRYAEAEPLYKRSLAIHEKALGPDHANVAADLSNLAELYLAQGRRAEAEPLFKRALTILEKELGPDHRGVANALGSLAEIYRAQGRYAEAEPLLKRALAIQEKQLRPGHPDVAAFLVQGVASTLNNLAALYAAQDRYAEAEPLYKQALTINERAQGPDHPNVANALNNLAWVALGRRNWAQAADYWQRATEVIARRSERGLAASEGGSLKGEAVRLSWYFSGLVKMTDRLAPQGPDRARLGKEMFETAQSAQGSDAASSLTQMAARSAKADTGLAKLVRERQDLVGEWQGKDQQLIAAKSQLPAKRGPEAEKVLSDRLAAIDGRLKAIDARFAKDFPEYASLTSSKPTSLAEVQASLGPNEALVLFLDTPEFKLVPEETFIWVVTKGDMRWVKSELGTKALAENVAALRCRLDDALWNNANNYDKCVELVKKHRFDANVDGQFVKVLPFDRDRAHALYKGLFGQIEELIKDKHLLIVPSGALTQLPFPVLVTEKPDLTAGGNDAFRRTAWLVRKHALTVLPSVSSLKALRQLAKDSHAGRALIGYGNPLLDGRQDDKEWGVYYKKQAQAARDKQQCPETPERRFAALTGGRRGVLPLELRGGLANVTQIRMQEPLPETADELCAVAHDLGVSGDEIRLGARTTEAEVKRLSEAGELAKYRVIHFATHGALAGQFSGNSEPGLLLTPPDSASESDDGYLSASEIAALKLDADWVILSACNTAAGGAEGAEALSGLARAFFYAGARALLVSHWAVYSDATVKLITGAVGRMAADKRVGRADALRLSMLTLIDKGTIAEAHPAFWAPFVVVGEGAAAQ